MISVPGCVDSGEGPLQVTDNSFFVISLHARKRVKDLLGVPIRRGLIPYMRALPLCLNHLPGGHLLIPSY